MLDDFGHRPLCDVGFVGPDKGEGGKYFILPPDYDGEKPAGYYTFSSRTYNVFIFWRAFRDKDGDATAAVELMEKTRLDTTEGEAGTGRAPDSARVTASSPRDAHRRLVAQHFTYYRAPAPVTTYYRAPAPVVQVQSYRVPMTYMYGF